MRPLDEQTILITGSTDGLGEATAERFARCGADVLVHGRSEQKLERALAKISDATYGLCVTCGDRIPVARLEVIPWAEQCVKCKARGERRR